MKLDQWRRKQNRLREWIHRCPLNGNKHRKKNNFPQNTLGLIQYISTTKSTQIFLITPQFWFDWISLFLLCPLTTEKLDLVVAYMHSLREHVCLSCSSLITSLLWFAYVHRVCIHVRIPLILNSIPMVSAFTVLDAPLQQCGSSMKYAWHEPTSDRSGKEREDAGPLTGQMGR